MELKKEITINFTEEEEKAIEIIAKMTEEFSALCGDNPECNKCPLNEFCSSMPIEQRVEKIKNDIINFLK